MCSGRLCGHGDSADSDVAQRSRTTVEGSDRILEMYMFFG